MGQPYSSHVTFPDILEGQSNIGLFEGEVCREAKERAPVDILAANKGNEVQEAHQIDVRRPE